MNQSLAFNVLFWSKLTLCKSYCLCQMKLLTRHTTPTNNKKGGTRAKVWLRTYSRLVTEEHVVQKCKPTIIGELYNTRDILAQEKKKVICLSLVKKNAIVDLTYLKFKTLESELKNLLVNNFSNQYINKLRVFSLHTKYCISLAYKDLNVILTWRTT